MSEAAHFEGWAARALALFGLAAPTFEPISHNENLTFRVAAEGQQFLLRLHLPRSAAFLGRHQQPTLIRSELLWLAALARDTPIPLQRPVPTRSGAWVALVARPSEAPIPATLLRWMDGHPMPVVGQAARPHAEALGALLARLHQQASQWQPPAEFVRPRYDIPFFQAVAERLAPGVALGIIRPADYECLDETLDVLVRALARLGQSEATWGLIHNDLHPQNLLLREDGTLAPLDFSLCGLGYFLHDLATSLGSLPVALRLPLLAGYRARRPLPDDVLPFIEGLMIASRLGYYTFCLADPEEHAWLRQRIPQVTARLCRPFQRGERFLFSER